MAIVLWLALIFTFTAGHGDRSVAGPIKGPDFLQFYTMGALVRLGHAASIYDMAALHEAQVSLVPESGPELYPPVYPPQAGLLFAPFSRLSYFHALILWSLVTAAAFGGIIYSVWRSVAVQLPDSSLVFAAAAAFPPFWYLILYGQVTIVIVAAFWAGWAALERRRPFLAGMAFGVLILKPQFAIPLAVVALTCGEWAMIAGAIASVAIQGGLVVRLLGWSTLKAYAAFVPIMLRYGDLLEPKPYQSHSLRALTRLLPPWIGVPLWIALAAIVLICAVRVWRTNAPVRLRVGVIVLASILVNPHVIVYDATVLALSVIWFGGYIQETRPSSEAAVFWAAIYWLCVTLLAPTAMAVGLQASVFIMMWLFGTVTRCIGADYDYRALPGARLIASFASSKPRPIA